MDFFQNQDDARRRTRRLLLLFAASVMAIVALLYTVAGFATGWESGLLDWTLLGLVAAVSAGTIGLGSGFRMLQLSAGGAVVARDLGGRQISPDTRQPDERRLLNIVEEMSLASGIPVPGVWVMDDEEAINAFAAGHSPADAVVGVTRGCLRSLSRDELQGVIAHEFSHILNGDMKLNLRLIGVVHGLLIMAILGRILLRFSAESGGGRGRNSSSDSKGMDPRAALLLAGAALLVLGYLGVFFGNLIKAAVCRQREFLADAAAVQFTRNPDSIGGALLKIGGYAYGSRLKTPRSEEAGHLMFCQAVGGGLAALLSTHPPLEERIRAILPHWDGRWPQAALPGIEAGAAVEAEDGFLTPSTAARSPEGVAAGLAGSADLAFPRGEFGEKTGGGRADGGIPPDGTAREGGVSVAEAHTALDRIGRPTPEEIAAARRLLDSSIPPMLHRLLRDSAGAQALVFAMLYSDDASAREREARVLKESVDTRTLQTVEAAAGALAGCHSPQLIAMIDLALPALRGLTPAEYGRFSHLLGRLIAADGQMDLFEFMLQKIVRRHLDVHYRRAPAPPVEVRRMADATAEMTALAGAFAGLSGRPGSAPYLKAAEAAGAVLRAAEGFTFQPPAAPVPLAEIDAALNRFDHALPGVKKLLLQACAAAVFADGRVSSHEAELLRAVADTIGCPVPPFVEGEEPAVSS